MRNSETTTNALEAPENPLTEVDPAEIERLAYDYWLEGSHEGTAEADWLRAESHLRDASKTPAAMSASAAA